MMKPIAEKGLEEGKENLFWHLLGRHPMEDAKACLERHTWSSCSGSEKQRAYLGPSISLLLLVVQAIYTSPKQSNDSYVHGVFLQFGLKGRGFCRPITVVEFQSSCLQHQKHGLRGERTSAIWKQHCTGPQKSETKDK